MPQIKIYENYIGNLYFAYQQLSTRYFLFFSSKIYPTVHFVKSTPLQCNLRISKNLPVRAAHVEALEKVDHARYLGVTITKNLNWKKHINNIISKATNTRLYLQRNLQSFERETKLLCYKVFVRPIVEYASVFGVQTVHNCSLIRQKWFNGKLFAGLKTNGNTSSAHPKC